MTISVARTLRQADVMWKEGLVLIAKIVIVCRRVDKENMKDAWGVVVAASPSLERKIEMKKMPVFCFSVLAIGLTLFITRAALTKSQDRQYQPAGFTLIQIEKVTPPGGETIQIGVWARMSNSRGEWRQTIQRFGRNGQISLEQTGGSERGVFKVIKKDAKDGDKLELLGGWMAPQALWYSERYYKSMPGSVKEENVLGYKAYVVRNENKETGEWEEATYIPQLGPIFVKMTRFGPKSGTFVVEPVSITLGEPYNELIKLPNSPISYDLMQNKVDDLEQKGKPEAAQFWQGQIETSKQKKDH
jgi:hypothetical protein